MAAVIEDDAAVFAAFEAVTAEIWNKIGVEQLELDKILPVLHGAKYALKKSIDSKESIRFLKRPVEAILKATEVITTTVCLSTVPAGHQMEEFFKKFQKILKIELMKVNKALVETRREERNIIIEIKSPKTRNLVFQMIAEKEAPVGPDNRRSKYTAEGRNALACLRAVVASDAIWTAIIPDRMLKIMVEEHDVDRRKKGAIIASIMMFLSNIVEKPGLFVDVHIHAREHIALEAQGIINDPALMMDMINNPALMMDMINNPDT